MPGTGTKKRAQSPKHVGHASAGVAQQQLAPAASSVACPSDSEQPVASDCLSASDSQVNRRRRVHGLVLSAAFEENLPYEYWRSSGLAAEFHSAALKVAKHAHSKPI